MLADDWPALAGRRVLIISGDLTVAAELEDWLTHEGILVVGLADSTARGLDLIQETAPELVVLDIDIAGESSTPVALALHRRGVPFIAVSRPREDWRTCPSVREAPRADKPVCYSQLVGLIEGAVKEATA